MERNIRLYPWFRFAQGLLFWQAVWFLYFQSALSASQAILLYVIYDIATTALEVPSGYMSDRWGRRRTLVASALAGLLAALAFSFGNSFAAFALGQVAMGAYSAFTSGTDSALLYESLAAEGRAAETEAQELKAWRASFSALALAALAGGALAYGSMKWPFYAAIAGFSLLLALALAFREPRHTRPEPPQGGELMRFASLRAAFAQPVLLWLFALGLVMYALSHVPFVFGQPYIAAALSAAGFTQEAPLVSGAVTAAMMAVSLAVSLVAAPVRRAIGLPAILLAALALQVAVIGALAATASALAILALLLRMVPNSLSQPFILARIQPLLASESRATYLSLRSFAGRLLFAATLWLASGAASGQGAMEFAQIRFVLGLYVLAGLAILAVLGLWARRVPLEP